MMVMAVPPLAGPELGADAGDHGSCARHCCISDDEHCAEHENTSKHSDEVANQSGHLFLISLLPTTRIIVAAPDSVSLSQTVRQAPRESRIGQMLFAT